jgi:CRP/FNR family transcriptional regulator, cyclic AMP receptor protein
MASSRRFITPDDCAKCTLHRDGEFCHLPTDPLDFLSRIGHITLYPACATLLKEGQVSPGVYIVCSGRVKLSVETAAGKTVILKIADRRRVLGLSTVATGSPAAFTATTMDSCQIKFVEREHFTRLMEAYPAIALACTKLLARETVEAFDDVHDLLLARSSTEKLVRLLLSWVANEPRNRNLRVASDFTHEEMAQMIGSSRETVTRLLSEMRRKELIRIEGSTLVIPNRVALQAIA